MMALNRVLAWTFSQCRRSQRLKDMGRRALTVPLIGAGVRSLATRISIIHEERVWAETPYGWIKFDPCWEPLYAKGIPEADVCSVLPRLLHRGDCFYDIGAHVGFYSLMVSRLVGPQGHVFAVEADPANAAICRQVIERNQLCQAEVETAAAWRADEEIVFRPSFGNHIAGRIDLGTGSGLGLGAEIRVQGTTLDSFCRRHLVPTVIKVDVEGAECEVLRGARDLLQDVRPLWVLEIHNPIVLEEIQALLPQFRYSLVFLVHTKLFPRHALGVPSEKESEVSSAIGAATLPY